LRDIGLSECGESDLGIAEVKRSVVVYGKGQHGTFWEKRGRLTGHHNIAKNPKLASNAGVCYNTADTVAGTLRDRPKVEGGGEGEVLAGECKGNFWKSSGAWKSIESSADRSVLLGPRDFGIERLDIGGVTNNEGGPRVNDASVFGYYLGARHLKQ
jgi:hypothetical protein